MKKLKNGKIWSFTNQKERRGNIHPMPAIFTMVAIMAANIVMQPE